MRKGLTTLMTVAIALVSVQAMAYAPMIDTIPSPIVGNRSGAPTQAQAYVYPDAFDLHTLATDDNNTSDQLIWSYELVAPQRYSINGIAPLAVSDSRITAAAGVKRIDNQVLTLPNPDAKTNTITIRDIILYPLGGSPSTSQSGPAWESQAITFWCSDGNLASSQTVMFYTDNTYTAGAASGINRLSNATGFVKQVEDKLLNGQNWHMYDPFFDHITSGTWTDGKGYCLNVTLTGQNWGSAATKIGFVKLVDNAVYRIRLQMNSNQMTPGKTPFWDFILENWNGNGEESANLYGVDTYFIDNEGGANAVIQKALGTEYTMVWAPAAFRTNQWRSTVDGIFAANKPVSEGGNGINYTKVRDAQLRFRVLDLDARADLQNNQKFGSVCMQNVIVETCPVSKKTYEATGGTAMPSAAQLLYGIGDGTNEPNLKAAHNKPAAEDPVLGNMMASALLGSSISFSGGDCTLQPSANGQSTEIVTITPAKNLDYTIGDWPTIADDWPIPWESNKIYELEVTMSAPDAGQAAHPWDVLWLNMEPPTNEVMQESYITANHGLATPKAGTPQAYYLYFHSMNRTASSVQAYRFLRWRIRWGNTTNCDWPNPSDTVNTGGVRIHSVKVNKVRFE
jgi:hypothetical protein